MSKAKNNIKEQVCYGIEDVENHMVEVKLRDLLLVYKTIEEIRRFFHQPMHYDSLEKVKEYIGNNNEGIYSIINELYSNVFDDMIPNDILSRIEDGELQCPDLPYYYKR